MSNDKYFSKIDIDSDFHLVWLINKQIHCWLFSLLIIIDLITLLRKPLNDWSKSVSSLFSGLDDICDYFGAKIAMYFAWLGFYTTSMLYPAVIGFVLWMLTESDQVFDHWNTIKLWLICYIPRVLEL